MTNSEQDACVIYSFKHRWLEPLKNGKVKLFFRKRVPSIKPKRIYLYVGTPVSSIIGWANVLELQRVSSEVAFNMAPEGAIDSEDLEGYLNGSQSVGVIHLGKPHFFSKPLNVSAVRRIFNFHPPQNFVQISGENASKLDNLAT